MTRQAYNGQQNVGDPVATIPEFTYKRVNTASGTSKDISGSGAILRGYVVNTVPVAAVTINDGSTPVFVIPTSVVLGQVVFLGDVSFRTNINITHSASAGNLTFIFKSF
jgi:hypothetical protein